jgi:hypothetical protein
MPRRFNLTFDYLDKKVYLDLSKYGNNTRFKIATAWGGDEGAREEIKDPA